MPDYIQKPASLFPNLVDEAITKKHANKSQLMQIIRDEHISMVKSQLEIEKSLWTVDEYVEHVIRRDKNPRDFIKDYFGEGGLCNKRVMDIRTLFFHLKFFPTDKSKIASHVPVTNLLSNRLTIPQRPIVKLPLHHHL